MPGSETVQRAGNKIIFQKKVTRKGGTRLTCRIRTVKKLQRNYATGELGNLVELDRTPEVRCLRIKMDDRTGCSPAFFKEMWKKYRIEGCTANTLCAARERGLFAVHASAYFG